MLEHAVGIRYTIKLNEQKLNRIVPILSRIVNILFTFHKIGI